jgi:chromosome segregation ATPase
MMGTSGSPSAVAGLLEGFAAMAKLLADPKSLEKLRAEFAKYGEIADKKLEDASALSADAQARMQAAQALEASNAAKVETLAEKEASLLKGQQILDRAKSDFADEVAKINTQIHADHDELEAREEKVSAREAAVKSEVDAAFKARTIELDRRATDIAEKENRLTLLEADLAERAVALEAREKQAKEILDKAAALSSLVSNAA